MSLTSELDDRKGPVARFFAEWFPNTEPLIVEWRDRLADVETIRPTAQVPYSTIGMALDYRLRYFFGVTPWPRLVAYLGARRLVRVREVVQADGSIAVIGEFDPLTGAPKPNVMWEQLTSAFSENLDDLLRSVEPAGKSLARLDEETLCRYCYVLALFEELFRTSRNIRHPLVSLEPGAVIEDLLAIASEASIDDMCRMTTIFFERHSHLLGQPAVLNPTFSGSRGIGGADADLIVGSCLIDIKTTVRPTERPKDIRLSLYQTLGYALLDYENRYGIEEVGVYLARQGVLLRWPVERLMSVLSNGAHDSVADARQAFQATVDRVLPQRIAKTGSVGQIDSS